MFVYGTLLRGESNHRVLEGAELLEETVTEEGYQLIDLGAYPAMCRAGDGVVVGELYAVSRDTLAKLDRLEEHPEYYQRVELRLSDGRMVLTYTMRAEKLASARRIESGDWRKRSRRCCIPDSGDLPVQGEPD